MLSIVFLHSSFEERFAKSGAASGEFTSKGEISAMASVGKIGIQVVEIEEGSIVDVIKVIFKGIIFVATVLSGVKVRGAMNVILAVSWIAIGENIGFLLVNVALVKFAHHFIERNIVLGRSNAPGQRGGGGAAGASSHES